MRLIIVEEPPRYLGNLGGTLAAWGAAQRIALDQGWDLREAVESGQRFALIHAAGQGRRASPLPEREGEDRSALLLPGRIGSEPPRLLTAVLAQTAPLAASLPPGFIDVIWCSQLFFPLVDPRVLPAPTAPLTKLVTRTSQPDPASTARADIGLFHLDEGGRPIGFSPQGQPVTTRAPLAADLGSSRMRLDLLDLLSELFEPAEAPLPVDLDPYLTAPLVDPRAPDPIGLAAAARSALPGEPQVGITDLGEEIPWFRLRRPREIRAFALSLRPSAAHGEPARRLLGIEHPITRSWIEGRWIEGPEIGWEEARAGLSLGRTRVQDSVIHDCELRDSDLSATVASWWCGGVRATESWLVAGGAGEAQVEAALLYRWTQAESSDPIDAQLHRGDPPALAPSPPDRASLGAEPSSSDVPLPSSVLAALNRRDLVGTLATLCALAHRGAFRLSVHAPAATPELDPPLLPALEISEGSLALYIDGRRWARLQHGPDRCADALLDCWLRAFAGPGTEPREALVRRRLNELHRPDAESSWAPPQDLLAAIASWSWVQDPDRSRLIPLFLALDHTPPRPDQLQRIEHARGWLRWRVEHHQDSAQHIATALTHLRPDLRATLAVPATDLGLPGDLPICDLRPSVPPGTHLQSSALLQRLASWVSRCGTPPRIGLCGPAAAGKSTLATALASLTHLARIPADALTWPGPELRYRQLDRAREVLLYGPGIYDDARIAAALRSQRTGCIADGVYLGLDPEVRSSLDLRIAVICEDRLRLRDKIERDQRPGGRRIDIATDFVHKVLTESRDGLEPLLPHCHLVWDRGTGALWGDLPPPLL